jgi:hypothetical protein
MECCKIVCFKKCIDCNRSFVDNKWCGEITCQRCLDLCWVINEKHITERIFACCDYHRPQISLNNMKITFDETQIQITEDEQTLILNDIEERLKYLNSVPVYIPNDEDVDKTIDDTPVNNMTISSSPIVEVALKIRNISKTIFHIK